MPTSPTKLTPRQREIMTLVAKGHRNSEVADALGISAATVRAHLHMVYEVLGVRNRTEAAMHFTKNGG